MIFHKRIIECTFMLEIASISIVLVLLSDERFSQTEDKNEIPTVLYI